MPKGEFDTPGPFRQMALGVRWNDRNVMGFNDNLDKAERDELTGLLNKGTHFEALVDALRGVSDLLSRRSPMTFSPERLGKEHAALEKADAALNAAGNPDA